MEHRRAHAAAPTRAPSSFVAHVFVAMAIVYVAAFVLYQTPGLMDRSVLEWDARAFPLHAWRFHGTGLFPDDFVVDAAKRYDTPVWVAVYWLGTLFTDPFEISKLLPFALLAVLLWQAYALGRTRGGAVLGAACVVAVIHCTPLWNRLVGGNPRAFGFPLIVALLRYAFIGAERRALVVLVLEGLAYPSALLCSAPAYALVALRRGRAPFMRAVVVSVVAAGCAAASLWGDPRMGSPPTYAQAATLQQMQAGGAQPYYPLPSFLHALAVAATAPFNVASESWHGVPRFPLLALGVLLACALFALRTPRVSTPATTPEAPTDPTIFFALPMGGVVAAGAAQLLAYRFYLPDRMLQLAWVPVAVLGMPLLLAHALGRRARGPLLASLLVSAFLLGAGGDGLPIAENLTDFGGQRSPTMAYFVTLPKDVLIAAHPERSSMIQIFARRRTLFSSSLNMTFLYEYARELERRIEAYYRAYYARDLSGAVALHREHHVDYLLVDARDFGPDARRRARYYAPWGALADHLLDEAPADALALAHPPADCVSFARGPFVVVDLRKLAARAP